MRIIAGSAGGIPLKTTRGDVRPTTDRVRECLFSILGDIHNLNILDLFGGVGSLGLEALSRGAASAVFVEANRTHSAAIQANALKARLPTAHIHNRDVFTWIKSDTNRYDLIFADPPWKKLPTDRDFSRDLLLDQYLPKLLNVNARFVLEEFARQPPLPTPEPWMDVREKNLGDTRLRFLRLR